MSRVKVTMKSASVLDVIGSVTEIAGTGVKLTIDPDCSRTAWSFLEYFLVLLIVPSPSITFSPLSQAS